MSNTPNPVNPAEAAGLGAIPTGGTTQPSYSTGVPFDYVSPTGRAPKEIRTKNSDGSVTVSYRLYDLNNDAGALLYQMSDSARKVLIESMHDKGLYGNGTPGNGLEDKDKSAFSNVLEFANYSGKPWAEAWADYYRMVPNSVGTRKAPSVRVTSADDLRTVFKKTASDLLGHELSDDENTKFAKLFQGMEVQASQRANVGGQYQDAPAAGTVAENQIQKQFGVEAQSFKAGGMAQIMDGMIKGLGA